MTEAKMIVLYPPPVDVDAFKAEYEAHKGLVAQNMPGFSAMNLTWLTATPTGDPPRFYLLAEIVYPSMEVLRSATSTREAAAVAKDAFRISTGGAPIFMIGE